MNKYSNGKIYTIRCEIDNNLIYVGSTVQPLYKRWNEHKRNASNKKEFKVYNKMNEIGIDKFYIELYELHSCNTREELNKREGELIRQIGTLNTVMSGRTKPEYYIDNKEKMNTKDKIYYNENKSDISERKKEILTCSCGCCVVKNHIARHMKTKKHIDLMNNIII